MSQDQFPPSEPSHPEHSHPESSNPEPQAASDLSSGNSPETPPESSEITPDPSLETSSEPIPPFSTPQEQPLSQTVQDVWKQVQPVLKTQTIRALRGTIRSLEWVADKLEEESGAPASGVRSEKMPPTSEAASDKPVPPFRTEELWEKFQPAWHRFQSWWAMLLRQVRSRLPGSLNQQLSDRALTGAIAGVFVLLLWITPGLFSSKPKPTSIAETPPSPTVISPNSTSTSPKSTSPKPTVPPELSSPEPVKPVSPQSSEANPSPKAVEASPSPIVKPPIPSPPPLKLTPEQKLIARIQDQVAEITDQYVNGLIQSVQANFRSSRLTIKVGEGWYGLSQPQQNKLANEMLQRAKELDFSKLEITDAEGTLLARSPVVGPEMIILRRQVGEEGDEVMG